MVLNGDCLCGAIQYEIMPEAGDVADYCHCTQCQKASGAPVLAWIQVKPERFRVITGQPKAYTSSNRATRWFCPNCGSPLYMTDVEGASVGVTLGTLDEPEAVQPNVHGWESARIAWFQTDDSLLRYPESPPYDQT